MSRCCASSSLRRAAVGLLALLAVGRAQVRLHEQKAKAPGDEAQAPVFTRYDEGGSVKVAPVPEFSRIIFESNVLSGAPHVQHWIVSFCPPWWEPCQKLERPFKALSLEWEDKLNHDIVNLRVRFARIDCATDKVLCNEQGVDTYPVVAHYTRGSQVSVWRGGTKKDAEKLAKWVAGRLGPMSDTAKEASADAPSLLSWYLTPGDRAFDVLLLVLGLAATMRLVLSNIDLWEKSPAADVPATGAPAAPAAPTAAPPSASRAAASAPAAAAARPAMADPSASGEPRRRAVGQLLPEEWAGGRGSLEL